MTKHHNKLVRDKIPEIIEKAGYLYSQFHFYDIYQNNRFADFFLESGARKIAIEIDDEASHNKLHISQNKFYDDLLK